MKHICSLCNKRVPAQYKKSHFRFHAKNPKIEHEERSLRWLVYKQDVKKK